MKKGWTFILAIALLFAALPMSARALGVVGAWSGTLTIDGEAFSASVTFHDGGAFTASANGLSTTGTYSLDGASLTMSARGHSFALNLSQSGSKQTIYGKGTLRGLRGSLSLSRRVRVERDDAADSSETAVGTPTPYGEWISTDDNAYVLRLYEAGFAYWRQQPAPSLWALISEQAQTEWGFLMTVSDDALALTPLDAESAPSLFDVCRGEDESALRIGYRLSQNGARMTLSDPSGAALCVLERADPLDEKPSEALFRAVLTLEKGDRGLAVEDMQTALKARGLLNGAADGIFGEKTRAAVMRLQKENALPETGVADADAFSLLYPEE